MKKTTCSAPYTWGTTDINIIRQQQSAVPLNLIKMHKSKSVHKIS